MARILKYVGLTQAESPIAFAVFPISAFAFLAMSFGYVALTIGVH